MLFNCKYFYFIFVFGSLYGQEIKTRIYDFNGDGKKDTLRSFYDGGSGFGGNYYTLVNGNNNEKFELDTWGCFCRSSKLILIPPALQLPKNKAFLDTLKKAILPVKLKTPDPTLQWIISGILSARTLSNNPYFEKVFTCPLKWVSAGEKFPEHYYIDLDGQLLDKLYFSDEEKPVWYSKAKNKGWLMYNGAYFGIDQGKSLIPQDSVNNQVVYKTAHAVLMKRENKFAWVFITDVNLTGSPEKLRWSSIDKVTMAGPLLIVQQGRAPSNTSNIFIVDTGSGRVGKLKFSADNNKPFLISDDQLSIEGEGSYNRFSIKKIIAELKAN